MANVPSNALPADLINLHSGFHGELPAHLVPVGASPQLRNVLCANGQVVAQAGFAKVTTTAPNGKRIIHITQVFRDPFSSGDPIIIVEKDEVNAWLPDANNNAGAFQDITPPPVIGFAADNAARPTSSLDHDGNLILATGQAVYWWPLSGNDQLGIRPAVYDKNPGVGEKYIQTRLDPTLTFSLVRLNGLADPRVLIQKAWVTSHFEPHVMLGRLYQGEGNDAKWYVNRYAWSDTNNSIRWFPGFDEETGVSSVAGFADIPSDVSHETPQILAMEQLRDLLIIYTDWNIWTLQFVGAPLMWVRRMVQGECGLAASGTVINCGDKHYFYGRDGRFYEFNGTDKQPIGKPVEDYVNKNIAGAVFGFRRLVPDSCVWAFSTDPDNAGVPDTAVAFNRTDGSWTIEDFPFTAARNVDASGIAGPIGAATSYDELTGTIDALTGAMDDLSEDADFRDTTSFRLNAEVMGSDDGHLYYRAGWTNDGSDRTHTWRSGVLDFGEQLRQKHLTAIEVAMVKDGLVNQGIDVPAGNYNVTVNVYASDRRERVGLGSPAQTQTYRPGTDDDACLWFRVTTRFMQFEVVSTSSAADPKPWALGRLTPYLIPMGLR